MSCNNGNPESQFAKMKLGQTLSDFIDTEDYTTICLFIIRDAPENLKTNVKKILNKFRSKDGIDKIISNLLKILNMDFSLWESDNIIKLLNELEEESVLLLSQGLDKNSAERTYRQILESHLNIMFSNHIRDFENMHKASPLDRPYVYPDAVFIHFSKLIDLNSGEAVLYSMTRFVQSLLKMLNDKDVLQSLTIELISKINHRLINYLLVTPGNSESKGLNEAITIYDFIRKHIINMTFEDPEVISKALLILEGRSRFFGLYADGMPENENHGDYIVSEPPNTTIEDDDVYDDYEHFLSTLPS